MIATLLALLFSLATHVAPAPHGSDSAGIGLLHPTLASPAAPAALTVAPAPSWDDRANPPAAPEGWEPATDSPMCAEDLGIVVDCWTP